MLSRTRRQLLLVILGGLSTSCAEEPGPPDLVLAVDQRDCRPGDSCSFAFDTLYVGEELAHAFVLSNRGEAPAIIEHAELSGSTSFELTQSFDGVIDALGSVPIVVTFAPTEIAEHVSQLVISASDPPAELRLDLLSAGVFPEGDVGTSGCNFGSVPVGTTATGCTIYIRNSTPVELEFTGMAVPPPFAVAQALIMPTFVDPGAMIAISLSVTPTAPGLLDASVTLVFGTDLVILTGVSVNGT